MWPLFMEDHSFTVTSQRLKLDQNKFKQHLCPTSWRERILCAAKFFSVADLFQFIMKNAFFFLIEWLDKYSILVM